MLSAHDLNSMQRISPFRNYRLFSEFLPKGYKLTTLSSVKHIEEVIELKVILGTLITLYDDFADRPDRLNSKLLQLLYRVPFESVEIHNAFLSEEEKESLKFSQVLFKKLIFGLRQLPNYHKLIQIFNFDLKQFFLANQYGELLTQYPYLSNYLENRLYLHHNMGIVMAGVIDLMSLPTIDFSELGQLRSLFLLGQRASRISNVITTYEREEREGDITNELTALNSDKNFDIDSSSFEVELNLISQKMKDFKSILRF